MLSEPVNNGVKDQWIEADGMAINQDTVKCEKVSERERGEKQSNSLCLLITNLPSFQAVTFGQAGAEEEVFDTDSHNLLVHFLNNDPDTLYRMN